MPPWEEVLCLRHLGPETGQAVFLLMCSYLLQQDLGTVGSVAPLVWDPVPGKLALSAPLLLSLLFPQLPVFTPLFRSSMPAHGAAAAGNISFLNWGPCGSPGSSVEGGPHLEVYKVCSSVNSKGLGVPWKRTWGSEVASLLCLSAPVSDGRSDGPSAQTLLGQRDPPLFSLPLLVPPQ